MAPEKGSFPLDHFAECEEQVNEYRRCLRKYNNDTRVCRLLARAYLECRMDRGLLKPEPMKDLGFDGTELPPAEAAVQVAKLDAAMGPRETPKEQTGFIAGLRTKSHFKQ